MFERSERQELFSEDSTAIPIIISYTEANVKWHNGHNNSRFEEFVERFIGIHNCIVINRGINEKNNKQIVEFILESTDFSVKVATDIDNGKFIMPNFFDSPVVLPDNESDCKKCKCYFYLANRVSESFLSENNLANSYDIRKNFITECCSLPVPFDDGKVGIESEKMWNIYIDGLSRLNQDKKNLLPIKSVSKPHIIKKFGELYYAVDVVLDIPSRESIFREALLTGLNKYLESSPKIQIDGEECDVLIDSYYELSDTAYEDLSNIAENNCYTLNEQSLHFMEGIVSLKKEDNFEEIMQSLEYDIQQYSDNYKREGARFVFYDEDVAEYFLKKVDKEYNEILNKTINRSIDTEVHSVSSDFTEEIQMLKDLGIDERCIKVRKDVLEVRSWRDILDLSAPVYKRLKFDHCKIRYSTKSPEQFDSSISVDGLSAYVVPNNGGYYEGIVMSTDQIIRNATIWYKGIKEKLGTGFKAQNLYYVFRKQADIELLKRLQREDFFDDDNIQVSAMRCVVKITPQDKNDYRNLINKVKSALGEKSRLHYPQYSIVVNLSLIYEEEEACKRTFIKIRNNIDDVISLTSDSLDYTIRRFEFQFRDAKDRDNQIEKIYEAFEPLKNLCAVKFKSDEGYTVLSFSKDERLEKSFVDSYRSFNSEIVKCISREAYDSVFNDYSKIESADKEIRSANSDLESIEEEMRDVYDKMSNYSYIQNASKYERQYRAECRRRIYIENDMDDKKEEKSDALKRKFDAKAKKFQAERERQQEINNVIFESPSVGACDNRSYDRLTILFPNTFDLETYNNNPIIKAGEYLYFPLSGATSEVNRQKNAMERILGKTKRAKNNPPVNPRLCKFLYNPKYAIDSEVTTIAATRDWVREHGVSKGVLNEKQLEAVAKAFACKDIAFIQGPPGTGKTTVIAEIIYKYIQEDENCKILLTSQNNLAVDNALDRLKKTRGIRPIRVINLQDKEDFEDKDGYQYMVERIDEWRDSPDKTNSVNAVERWLSNIESSISDDNIAKYGTALSVWAESIRKRDSYSRDLFCESYKNNVNIFAATCSYCDSKGFKQAYNNIYHNEKIEFDLIIMDEASKATLPEMAVPMVYGKKIILIGDHRQLPPVLSSEHKKAFEIMGQPDLFEESYETLKTSHFGTMFKIAQKCHPNTVATLDTQYRMHEEIMNTINQFYKRDVEGGLKCGIKSDMDKPDWSLSGSRWHGMTFDKVLTPEKHAIWVDVDTPETALNPGFKNRGEVEAIKLVLKMLKSADGYKEYITEQKSDEDKEIGIITFYSGQKKAIRDAKLDSSFKYRISAVDKFQGMERNIVIVSTVRSNHEKNIGFARESERINVAFSRAKRLLIVVGNKKLFSRFEDYHESIDNMHTVDLKTLRDLLK